MVFGETGIINSADTVVWFSLIKGGVEVAYVLFDGAGTDKTSWFSQARILESSWTALKTDPDVTPLDLVGSCDQSAGKCRRFPIWENAPNCLNDVFYSMVIDDNTDSCNNNETWEVQDLSTYPVILYSPGTGQATLSIERECRNRYGEATVCGHWASHGECGRNPAFMLEQCRVDCGGCPTDDPEFECKNTLSVAEKPICQHWADIGECHRQPVFMPVECRKACRGCNAGETWERAQEADVLAVWVKFA
ncbi:hypothetical protein EGW08_012424 [Elysia chlorotica]|uniref:ShKT domain-containing protein n=1 Tax=Elysia chlorotica TaxID=188477 RepID=A0A3S1A0T6_ELYCH|nr:hypothetical protein EGW08_012424 [Elysia chlorotica]